MEANDVAAHIILGYVLIENPLRYNLDIHMLIYLARQAYVIYNYYLIITLTIPYHPLNIKYHECKSNFMLKHSPSYL